MAAKRKRRNEKKAQNAVRTKKTVETKSAKKAKSPDSAGKTIGMVGPGNRKGVSGSEEPASYGKVASCRTAITDITERKQMEEALRQSNEELNRFNKVMVGRELRIIELKKEVNELCDLNGQKQRYPLKFEKENENEKNETRI